jgi:hypothetical protein
VNAFTQTDLQTDPRLNNKIPALMTIENKWYRSPTGGNKTKNTPNALLWNKSFDYDRRGWKYYHDTLDCAYPTGAAAYTAALGGYPVGDLNWFPTRYAAWLVDPINSVPGDHGLPSKFTLEQNYPNPFNPSTNISFVLERSAYTTLAVYNVLGQRVATLLAQNLTAGPHDVRFDATTLSTGVYFYKLQSGSLSAVKKMLLVR